MIPHYVYFVLTAKRDPDFPGKGNLKPKTQAQIQSWTSQADLSENCFPSSHLRNHWLPYPPPYPNSKPLALLQEPGPPRTGGTQRPDLEGLSSGGGRGRQELGGGGTREFLAASCTRRMGAGGSTKDRHS